MIIKRKGKEEERESGWKMDGGDEELLLLNWRELMVRGMFFWLGLYLEL